MRLSWEKKMTLITFDDSIKLDTSQKLLLNKHFSMANSNMMPHKLAAMLGLNTLQL